MHPIWNLIIKWLNVSNITLTLRKVKGHSDDTLNQHADKLAQQGLTSPVFVILPEDIHFNTTTLTAFRNRFTMSVLEMDTREFVQNLQQAIFFEQLISLKRYASLLPLHDSKVINWDCTLFCLQHDL